MLEHEKILAIFQSKCCNYYRFLLIFLALQSKNMYQIIIAFWSVKLLALFNTPTCD